MNIWEGEGCVWSSNLQLAWLSWVWIGQNRSSWPWFWQRPTFWPSCSQPIASQCRPWSTPFGESSREHCVESWPKIWSNKDSWHWSIGGEHQWLVHQLKPDNFIFREQFRVLLILLCKYLLCLCRWGQRWWRFCPCLDHKQCRLCGRFAPISVRFSKRKYTHVVNRFTQSRSICVFYLVVIDRSKRI